MVKTTVAEEATSVSIVRAAAASLTTDLTQKPS
jgi:hypothetical protein